MFTALRKKTIETESPQTQCKAVRKEEGNGFFIWLASFICSLLKLNAGLESGSVATYKFSSIVIRSWPLNAGESLVFTWKLSEKPDLLICGKVWMKALLEKGLESSRLCYFYGVVCKGFRQSSVGTAGGPKISFPFYQDTQADWNSQQVSRRDAACLEPSVLSIAVARIRQLFPPPSL